MNGREGDGVDDIVHLSAAWQIVHRLAQALQHWPEADAIGAALHGFVSRIAGVQVREHKNGGSACHLAVGGQLPGDYLVGGGIVLQRAVDQQ